MDKQDVFVFSLLVLIVVGLFTLAIIQTISSNRSDKRITHPRS